MIRNTEIQTLLEQNNFASNLVQAEEEKVIDPPRAAMTFEDCKAKGGESLTYNYTTSSWQCLTPAIYPHYTIRGFSLHIFMK